MVSIVGRVSICAVGDGSAASATPSEAMKRTITFSKSHILTALFPIASVVDDQRCKLIFKGFVSRSSFKYWGVERELVFLRANKMVFFVAGRPLDYK